MAYQGSTTVVNFKGKMWGGNVPKGDEDFETGRGFQQGGATMTCPQGKKSLGKATLVFVKRYSTPSSASFFSACDALSSDLQATGCLLFCSNGSPRHPFVKELLPPSEDHGEDFLYLADLNFEGVSEEEAPSALKDMLQGTLLRKKFVMAAFYLSLPAGSGRQTLPPFPGTELSPEAKAEVEREKKLVKEGCDLYRLHVVRAGFQQVEDTSVYIITPSGLSAPVLTRAQALAVPTRERPKKPELSPIDKELLDVYLKATSKNLGPEPLPAAALGAIKEVITRGASLVSSTVLHYVSANGSMAVLTQLLALLPPGGASGAVNAQDYEGTTPLHLAARYAIGAVSSLDPEAKTEFCGLLLSLGANRGTQQRQGLTALGVMLQAKRNFADFHKAMGSQPTSKSLALERMLLPEEGPSKADEEYAEVSEVLRSRAASGGGSKRMKL